MTVNNTNAFLFYFFLISKATKNLPISTTDNQANRMNQSIPPVQKFQDQQDSKKKLNAEQSYSVAIRPHTDKKRLAQSGHAAN